MFNLILQVTYFEKDLKVERILLDKDGTVEQIVPSREDSLDRLIEDNFEQFSDTGESLEDDVIRRLSYEKLHKAIEMLAEEEKT